MNAKQIEDLAWQAHPYTFRNNRGSYKTASGHYIRYGIPEPRHPDTLKGGDRIGWHEITITPDMVGKKVAVFCNIEIKTKNDRIHPAQKRWHNLVLEHGGISEIWQEAKNGDIKRHTTRLD